MERGVGCKCIEKMDKKLREEKNNSIDIMFSVDNGPMRCIVRTTQLNKGESNRKYPAVTVAATYCPFCGKKYPEKT